MSFFWFVMVTFWFAVCFSIFGACQLSNVCCQDKCVSIIHPLYILAWFNRNFRDANIFPLPPSFHMTSQALHRNCWSHCLSPGFDRNSSLTHLVGMTMSHPIACYIETQRVFETIESGKQLNTTCSMLRDMDIYRVHIFCQKWVANHQRSACRLWQLRAEVQVPDVMSKIQIMPFLESSTVDQTLRSWNLWSQWASQDMDRCRKH